jgi:hypothetical protein
VVQEPATDSSTDEELSPINESIQNVCLEEDSANDMEEMVLFLVLF